mmetsp:Transcript_11089/g.23779  ORF Transcript_11089/g.23779 Transcript_11089/m.23779 type:complete len:234 (-) Transcript_11089:218-919(-)
MIFSMYKSMFYIKISQIFKCHILFPRFSFRAAMLKSFKFDGQSVLFSYCSVLRSGRGCLIFLAFLLSLTLDGVDSDLFVVLLQGSQILTGLGELSLLHTLSDVPVDEGTLGVHQVELVVKTSPGLGDGGGVAQHAHGTLDLGQVSPGNDGGGLVVDAHLESSGTPVHKLDGALGLDGGNGRIHILWDDISSVQHAASHVLAVTRITFHHLVGWFEASIGNFCNRQLLMVSLLC